MNEKELLQRVAEIGVRAAAAEAGIAWQTLAAMRKKAEKAAADEEPKAEEKAEPKRGRDYRISEMRGASASLFFMACG